MQRSSTDQIIAGVCAGLADHYGIPTLMMRIIFFLMFVPGTPLYLYLWVTLPLDEEEEENHQVAPAP